MEFRELADLRLFLRELRDRQVESLKEYYDGGSGGFYHRHDKPTRGRFSKSSTATCVLSLIAASQWQSGPWERRTEKLLKGLLNEPWESAGLDEDNVFTVAFILEAVDELRHLHPEIVLDQSSEERLKKAEAILKSEASKGALSVQGYPPSAYVTQLVIRTLNRRKAVVKRTADKIEDWAEREVNRQAALLTANEKTADVFQLAYSAILLANLVKPDRITPDQEFIIETSLEELFRRQRDDGTWQLSRPLFHYPNVGSAHCFDYEMLVQLLSEPRLSDKLLRFIPHLAKSARALSSSFPLGTGGAGWSSGHHPQFRGPESWSTASVYHFAHAFERLITEEIRFATFAYLQSKYTPPRGVSGVVGVMPEGFLDCRLQLDGQSSSLKDVVKCLLTPLLEDEAARRIESGGRISATAPVSIILFGPPGTSKTRLADIIATQLGWPLLSIDASQFLKNGMDGVYAEADRVFGMLAIAERVLVLLDEFDEMVRARETAHDVLSRFLTAAMLPKLHKINDNRRLVFIVATNHIEAFDVAIRRPGRFDAILQVMPPTVPEKLRKWKELAKLIRSGISDHELNEKLEPLTYAETEILVRRLVSASSSEAKRALLEGAHASCTMLSITNPTDDSKKTWKAICEEQSALSRVP